MFGPGLVVFLLIGVLLLVLLTVVGWVVARSPLRRGTVERFAARQRLAVTDGNAAHVVGALLITHRWRRAGLVLGLAVGVVWSLREASLTVHFLAGLLGWFAGAVVAEWRVSGLHDPGARRVAALAPRGVALYLTPAVRVLAGLTGAAVLVLLAAAAARGGVSSAWAGWLGYSAALAGVLALTARAVVARASGFVEPDLREADDALRCHGLTVLAGTGIAASYPAISGLVALVATPDRASGTNDGSWALLIFVACLLTGLWVAVWSPSAREARASTQGERGPEATRSAEAAPHTDREPA